jgi:magnesium transporter
LYPPLFLSYNAYDMVTYFYKDVRAAEVQQQDSFRPGSWVCAEHPSKDEIDQLVEKFNLDLGHMTDALDADEMPRIEREGDTTYIFVRYAYVNDELELTTAPLLFVFHPKVLITVALNSLPRLQHFTSGKIEFSTTQKTKLLLQILSQIVDQYEVYINNISKRIKAIRSRLRSHEVVNQDFIDFVTIEDELNEFLSSLQPTTAILRRLLVGKHVPLYDQDQDIIEDLLLNNEQSIESCRSLARSIINIREAHTTITNNNLNRSMKTLTAATVIIALPNVFYGMFGMNVGLPFADESWAYGLVVGITVVITIAVVIIGRVKRVF